jgi:amino acid adenylation domain-containing protein
MQARPHLSENTPNLVELLADRAERHPDRVVLRFLGDGETVTDAFTYRQLHERACSLGARLGEMATPGDRALLLYPSGPEYVTAFLGCLYAGLIAVPAYPPESTQVHHLRRLAAVLRDAAPKLILTPRDLLGPLSAARTALPEAAGIELLATDRTSVDEASRFRMPDVRRNPIAFLQYTSGSTGAPKGVIVGHDNLMANEAVIRGAFAIDERDVVVSWLPLFHDMGLIGGLLQPIFSGASVVLMTPQHFIERPLRWVEAISRHGGTVSGGPDFAYRMCVERARAGLAEDLDLRSWRVAFSGAEPVRLETLEAFRECFSAAGFEARALYPCYGLAESTLFVSGGESGAGARSESFDAAELGGDRARLGAAGVRLVSCGKAPPRHRIEIVDVKTSAPVPDGGVGEIQVSGPSVAHGYWNRERETAETFIERDGQRFLRTGDLGFLQRGELFVTGRHKDMIIIRGQNLYPQDIERVMEEQVEVLRKGRIAAFGIDVQGREAIGVAAEVPRSLRALIAPEAVCRAMDEALTQAFGERAALIVLLNSGGLPITPSGKLQRRACREHWQDGVLDAFAVFEAGVLVGARAARPSTPGRTGLAADIESIWSELLHEPSIRSEDTFFALGGSSLVAAQMLLRVGERLGGAIDPAVLFDAPAFDAFVARVTPLDKARREKTPVIPTIARDLPLPVSSGERRLWFLWSLDRESTAYVLCGGARLQGPLDHALASRAFEALVARHEPLRTTYRYREGQVERVVHSPEPVELGLVDRRGLESRARERAVGELAEELAQRPFDLERGPLFRALFVQLDENEHELLVAVHHIVFDGWSLDVLANDFLQIAARIRSGQSAILPALPLQYADYAAWQRGELEAGRCDTQLAALKERLGREHPPLGLATDGIRSGAPSSASASCETVFPARLRRDLEALARRNDTTLATVLLAAFHTLLYRHSGQRSIRIGVPTANRARVELSSLIGFFVNTVVVGVEVDDDERNDGLIRRVTESFREAQRSQDVPFERVVEAVNPERRLDRNPLFQAMFNHSPAPRVAASVAELRLAAVVRRGYSAPVDLTLDTFEAGEGLAAVFTYGPELFERDTIERLAGCFGRLLEELTRNSETPVGRLALLGAHERAEIEGFNETHREHDSERIHALIERQVERAPERFALVYEDVRLSYRELNARANQLARRLRAEGVGPDRWVAVVMERSIEMVVALLAVLKAGGAYVPIDPDHPPAHVGELLAEVRPVVVLTLERLRGRVPEGAATVRTLDGDWVVFDGLDASNLVNLAAPANAAYCIYTSGSTGRPKGVMNSHAGLTNRLCWMQERYRLGADDRVLQKTPYGFDVSVWEFFWPLLSGATLVVARPGVHQDPRQLSEVIRREKVTTIHFVPSMLHAFVDSGELSRAASLRRIVCSGEALSIELARKVWHAHRAELHNLYGPTEASIDVTAWECREEGRRSIPIGRAISNTAIHVLDRHLAPVPVGVTGELYIGGIGLARGYLGRPDLSAERFVPNPYGAPGGRLYRTGDLARYRADGAVEYVGRADHQVKLRGFRIELGEIEHRLLEDPSLRQAAVLVREDTPGERRLVAYVVAEAAERADASGLQALRTAIRARLLAALPEYMVPQLYVFLSALPVSSNGKLDRRGLPAPNLVELQREYVPPSGEREEQLASVLRDVLRLERVGAGDNFFELGGDSILALQVVDRAKQLGLELSPRDLFEHQTLRELAGAAREWRPSEQAAARGADPLGFGLTALTDEERARLAYPLSDLEDAFPLSPMQQGLLVHTLLEPGSGIYWMQDHYRIESAIDPDAFCEAWRHVLARHPALRASFVWERDGKMLQLVHREVPTAVTSHDWRDLAPAEQERQLVGLLAQERAHGFDLRRPPLMRVHLFRLGEQRFEFVQSYHHILIDDWCRSLMLVDFFAFYRAAGERRDARLPEIPRYRDFIGWLARKDPEEMRRYWNQELEGFDAATSLGVASSAVADDGGSRIRDLFVHLEEGVTQAVMLSARRLQITVNTLAQGAWAVLLSQYSGASDVLFGITVAGRPTDIPEIQRTVGLFINSIPLRVRVPRASERARGADFLRALQQKNAAMRQHEHFPLVEIQATSAVPPGEPLFHSLFVFENAPLDRSLLDRQIEFNVGFVRNRTHTNYPLTVVLVPGQQLKLQLSYDERRFEEQDIRRMLAHFSRLLVALSTFPESELSRLPVLDGEEIRTLDGWNETRREYPWGDGFPALFAARVTEHPARVAAASAGVSWTYAELDRRSNGVARALDVAGAGAESVVAVMAERGLCFLAGVLGAFKTGAAYLPLDVRHPAARVARLLASARPRAVLVGAEQEQRITDVLVLLPEETRPQLVRLEAAASDESAPPRAARVHPAQLAYVLYTSGSTGEPKGVLVTSRGMLNNQLSKLPALGLTEMDVIGQTAAPSFDISVWQLLTALLIGARVEIVPDAIAADPTRLLEYAEGTGITVLEHVPSVIQGMLSEAAVVLERLRCLLPTGEALPPELARRWMQRYPGVRLVNAYGPAECSDDVALHVFDAPPAADAKLVPIGAPTDNHRLFVLDSDLRRVAIGITGELCVAGVGVGRGYLGDPTRTADVFVPNPFAEHPGERLYRTGDLARYRRDGRLECVGRADHQVKIRGHRIELGEIEARLLEVSAVREAVVVTRRAPSGDSRLVAYVVPTDAAAQPEAFRQSLRDALRATLPEYMVPETYVALDALPRTTNGKLDRRALPAPEAEATAPFVAPQTLVEQQLAAIWKEVLGVGRVGLDDDFFELGGHSLLATQVASRLARRLSVELPLRALFEARTLRELAERVARAALARSDAPELVVVDRSEELPLSFAQQRLWFSWRMDPDSAVYNLTEAARWKGELDLAALEASFTTILRRHEALRTRFIETNGQARQVIDADASISITLVRASGETQAERETQARQIVEAQAERPFDLSLDRLLRVSVVQLAERDQVIVVTAHHIVADGWSMHLMVDEFAALYAAYSQGRELELRSLPIQYADFAVWQRRWLEGGELSRQLAYWTAELGSEHPVIALPWDRPRPPVQSGRGATLALALDEARTAGLRDLAREREATLFSIGLTAFQLLLHRYTGGQQLIRVGVPVANRTRFDLEGLVGFFVNTPVVQTSFEGAPTFSELLRRVTRTALAAQAHQDVPFERVVEALNPERSLGHNPLFQVTYNHLRPEHGALEQLPGVSIEWMTRVSLTTPFDLTVNAVEEAERLRFAFTYSTDLFERETVERMALDFERLLGEILSRPDEPVDHLNLLDEAARRNLTRWNATDADYDRRPIHELIQAMANERPEAIAVRWGDVELAYGELDARANRLARWLREQGVGPEVLVGVYGDRSPDLVISMLAVWRAGGAYVPLDPAHPAERVDALCRQAGITLLLTEQRVLARLSAPAPRAWCWDRDGAGLAGLDAGPLAQCTHPASTAYVLHTSGSTGQPKGVVVSHAALTNHMQWMRQSFEIDASDQVLQKTAISFDASVWEFWLPLMLGGRLVLATSDPRDPDELLSEVRRQGVTVLQVVPTLLRALIDTASGPETLKRLRYLFAGGEALEPELVRALDGPVRLHNLYGPTETTIDATSWSCSAWGSGLAIPIGAPIANVQAHVLDGALNAAPMGVTGEIHIGGAALARGYLGRPDATAERFVPDPHALVPGARLYRTGDLGRRRQDGAIEYRGRVDQQVKIRGQRVELGEIEAKILEQGAAATAVIIRHDPGTVRRLVAYVVPRDPAVTSDTETRSHYEEALRERLKAALPEPMLPSAFVFLEALPLTSSGKLDRRALPVPALGSGRKRHVAPQNDIERTLVRIWQEVLGIDRVGVADNFFELGGDSIIVLQMAGLARAAGIALSPRDVFAHQTIESLATVARALADSASALDLPLGIDQRRLLESDEAARAVDRLEIEARSGLDRHVLERALAAVAARHPALRLRVRRVDGTPRRWSPTGPCVLETVDLRRDDDPDALERVRIEAVSSLDPEQGAAVRVLWVGRGEGRAARLIFVAHRVAVDARSWEILLSDLDLAYRQLREGQPIAFGIEAPIPGVLEPEALADRDLKTEGSASGLERAILRRDVRVSRDALGLAERTYRVSSSELCALAVGRALCAWTRSARTALEIGRRLPDLDAALGPWSERVVIELPHGGAELTAAVGVAKSQLRSATRVETTRAVAAFFHDEAPRVPDALGALAEYRPSRAAPAASACIVLRTRSIETELSLEVAYCTDRFEESAIEALARAVAIEIEALAAAAAAEPRGVFTVADFPLLGEGASALAGLDLDPREVVDAYPMTPMQYGIFMHSELSVGSGIYHMQHVYRVKTAVDARVADVAWRAVVAAHDMLRTSFHLLSAQLGAIQVVHRRSRFACELLDWSGAPGSRPDWDARLQELLAEELEAGFELSRPESFRVRLVRLPDQTCFFVCTFHHILMDAWAFSTVLADFFARYAALLARRSLTSPRAPDFKEYVRWLGSRDLAEAKSFWARELAGFAHATPVGFAMVSAADDLSNQGVEDVYAWLGEEATARLLALSRQLELTVNTFVQAAWAIVLARHAGLRDIVFGVTVAGRPMEMPGVEAVVGLFIQSIPLRVLVDESLRSVDFLRALLEKNAKLRHYEHLPLTEIGAVSEVRGTSLFHSLFVFENAPLAESVIASGAAFGVEEISNRTHTNYPLTVVAYPGRSLGLHLSYNPLLFERDEIEVLMRHFRAALSGLIGGVDRPLRDVRLSDGAEAELVARVNRTGAPSREDADYVAAFETTVQRHGERMAARAGERHWTYAELNRRASRVAQALVRVGVRLDDRVALLDQRGLPLLAMMVGVAKAGAAFASLDPKQPLARLRETVTVAAPSVLIVGDAGGLVAHALFASESGAALPRVMSWSEIEAGDFPESDLRIPARPNQLAYVITTSGSTGKPKGVMVEAAGMLNNQRSKIPYLGLTERDVIAQTASQSFDISVWQFLTAGLVGAAVEIVDEAVAADPVELLRLCAERDVTVLECVPSVLKSALARGDELPTGEQLSLRWVLPTGEALSAEVARSWFERYTTIPLVNAYGPAECSDDVTLHTQRQAPGRGVTSVPIGLPVENTRVHVLDGQLSAVALGVTGELCVAGVGVGRGYLGDPARTAEAFVPNPHAEQPGERLYRTGDLGRHRPDGTLEYQGRFDHQVKVRGYRIELGEIEARLLQHGAVHDAAVSAWVSDVGDQHLVAYVVLDEPPSNTGQSLREQLRAHLKPQLPEYMVPNLYVALARLPRTQHGKLDRQALPAPDLKQAESSYIDPRNELERQLARIWSEVLRVERVGVHDNFFDLGGHSLLATQVLSRVRQELGVELELRALFEATTVAELASAVERKGGVRGRVDADLSALLDKLGELEQMP